MLIHKRGKQFPAIINMNNDELNKSNNDHDIYQTKYTSSIFRRFSRMEDYLFNTISTPHFCLV